MAKMINNNNTAVAEIATESATMVLEREINSLFTEYKLSDLSFEMKLKINEDFVNLCILYNNGGRSVVVDDKTLFPEESSTLRTIRNVMSYWASHVTEAQEVWLRQAEPVAFDRRRHDVAILTKGCDKLIIHELFTPKGTDIYMFSSPKEQQPVFMVVVSDLLDEIGDALLNAEEFDDIFFQNIGTYRFYKSFAAAYDYAVTMDTRDSWVEYPEGPEHDAPAWVSEIIPL